VGDLNNTMTTIHSQAFQAIDAARKASPLTFLFRETSVNDYSAAITALIVVTMVISAAVVYVLVQPTDLPRYKENKDQ